MINFKPDNYGNVILIVSGVEYLLENSDAHKLDTELGFALQEADEAYWEFSQKHRD